MRTVTSHPRHEPHHLGHAERIFSPLRGIHFERLFALPAPGKARVGSPALHRHNLDDVPIRRQITLGGKAKLLIHAFAERKIAPAAHLVAAGVDDGGGDGKVRAGAALKSSGRR